VFLTLSTLKDPDCFEVSTSPSPDLEEEFRGCRLFMKPKKNTESSNTAQRDHNFGQR
jgi:hypothetical protein